MFKKVIFISVVFLVACQTVKEKNIETIRDRTAKLQALAKWKPTWCTLETHLTQPALARYKEMFPEEADKLSDGSLNYTWKARSYTCEITPLESSPLTKNHVGFLETALCVLLQTHWVNSPFEQLEMIPRDIDNEKDGTIHIQSSMIDKALGVYLDPVNFKMETRTKGHGILKVLYTESANHEWLPSRLEQVTPKARLLVDSIEYDTAVVGRRHLIKSMWISVGDAEVFQHTQVSFSGCQNF
ncbi:MAG: hypothetical protein ACXVA9_10075 [Bdellovibrionales bacterium]